MMVHVGRSSFDVMFDLLREQPETTRTELVKQSNLSKATVSETIAELMGAGFLAEIGKRQHGRGRSQVVLELQARNRLVIGAHFGEHDCRAALCDLRGAPVAFATRAIPGSAPEVFVDALAACVAELMEQAKAPVLGIGVGVPGLVSQDGRSVVVSVPHGWRNVPFCEMVEARTGHKVVIANRAKVAALGEYWVGNFPEGTDRSQVVYVFAGAGIIAGYVFEGDLYIGHNGSAGELGHTTVEPEGQQCGCGNRGCLHTLASESAIVRAVRGQLRRSSESPLMATLAGQSLESLTIEMLHEAARAGDEMVLAEVRRAGTWLGVAIGNLINLLNPSIVVIGGSFVEFGEVAMASITEEIRRRALWDALHSVTIVPSQSHVHAGISGAAAMFLNGMTASDLLAS
jgi:predicted NBD/HSP70 family sugar kinase/predicted transcriptional regulator